MKDIIQRKIRQYLVHSFLYYKLGESIIPDRQFDQICKDILNYKKNNSEKINMPYQDILDDSLANDASGFSIQQFPNEIVSSALHLLYQKNYSESLSFKAFLSRFGYTILEESNAK